MTIKELLTFQCMICNKSFMSYCYGHYINLNDCYTNHERICFYDNTYGEIHSNSYVNPIKNKGKCRKCRKSHQLEEYVP